MAESSLSVTYLDAPNALLHLFGPACDPVCGARGVSGTTRVFEHVSLTKRCPACQEQYLQTPIERVERERNRFLAV